MSESSLPSPREQSSSAMSSSIALLDQGADTMKERGWENQLTACSQIPDLAHMEKRGLEIGPAPQPQDRLVGI